jgi:molecular chaperone GrpE
LSLRGYVSELLPILDSLELAQHDAAGEQMDPKRVKEALDMIGLSLKQALAVRGLQRIEVKGKPFDPKIHEAVAKRPADQAQGEKPGTVLEELRPGYLWKGLVLRPAQVLVSELEKS